MVRMFIMSGLIFMTDDGTSHDTDSVDDTDDDTYADTDDDTDDGGRGNLYTMKVPGCCSWVPGPWSLVLGLRSLVLGPVWAGSKKFVYLESGSAETCQKKESGTLLRNFSLQCKIPCVGGNLAARGPGNGNTARFLCFSASSLF